MDLSLVGADLSGANWTNASFPLPGNVAIDSATGRFKFSSEPAVWQCELVKTINDAYLAAGSYQYEWSGHNAAGTRVAGGVYIIRV